MTSIITQKVVLLGEGCVGKTSIVSRYISDTFEDKHISTIQAAFFEKLINIDGTRLKLSIWDTAGQEKFHALGPIYYRESKGAILVYDVTDKDSFDRVRNWVVELKQALKNDCVLIIVGNKTDLEKDRKVTEKDAIEYSKSVGAIHMMTSARLNKGIQELFYTISKSLIRKLEEQKSAEFNGGNNPTRSNNIVIVPDPDTKSNRSSCC